jgi:hypothetical protein
VKEVAELDHLQALPLTVMVRTAKGEIRARNENGWTRMGSGSPVSWDVDDFPAKVMWSYAEEVGDPGVEALANLALVMLRQQFVNEQTQQQQAARITEQFTQQQAAQANGQVQAPPQVQVPQQVQVPPQSSGGLLPGPIGQAPLPPPLPEPTPPPQG